MSLIEKCVRVRMELPSRPESMMLVRAALSAVADAGGLRDELTDDLKTAVSEACNNVVVHAYAGEAGPLILSLATDPLEVVATVQDHGQGIRRLSVSDERMGVGLAVISALADRVELESGVNGNTGTSVRMSFSRLAGDGSLGPAGTAGANETGWASELPDLDLAGDIVVWLSPTSVAAPVLCRLIRAVAAGSHFTLARVGELRSIEEMIDTFVRQATAGPTLGFAIDSSVRRLTITGGPFAPGSAAAAQQRARGTAVEGLRTVSASAWDVVQMELVDRTRDPVGPREQP